MDKDDRDRVVFHSKQDMASGYFLSKAETILNNTLQAHTDFTRGMKTEDDITLVVIKIS